MLTLHGTVLTHGRRLPDCRVQVKDGRIHSVEPHADPTGVDLRAGNGWITAGLIDLQVNGAGGQDITAAADAGPVVESVARTLARHGVTAFCPTIVSSLEETVVRHLPALAPRAFEGGAASLGGHVEGPFISSHFRGVHDPANLREPTPDEAERWLAVGTPAIVTLAPEVPGALEAVDRFTKAGVAVSLGHSGADLACGREALARGARLGTHLFNAMPPLHHRQPGLVGALLEGSATLGVIADGTHLDPLVLDFVVRLAGTERVALVSDALAAAGMPPGPVQLGEQTVVSDGKTVRRADGTLAGSALLLDSCLANAVAWLPWLDAAEAVRMATSTPAAVLGPPVASRKGQVAEGFDADLAVWNADWSVAATVVGGALVYQEGRA